MNQIAAAIAGNPNIIVGKNPDMNVPAGLTPSPATYAGALANIEISPLTPPKSPPNPVVQTGIFRTWCNPNGINILLTVLNIPIIPAFPQ